MENLNGIHICLVIEYLKEDCIELYFQFIIKLFTILNVKEKNYFFPNMYPFQVKITRLKIS